MTDTPQAPPAGAPSVPLDMKRPLEVKRPRGRPPVYIDLDTVERLASVFCTMRDIAAAMGVGYSVLTARKRAVKELADAVARGRSLGRASLRRRLWERSQKSDRVLLHLAEHHLGQAKRVRLEGGGLPIKHQIEATEDDRIRRIAQLADVVVSDPAVPADARQALQGLIDAGRKPKP